MPTQLPNPNQSSPITDVLQFGATWPTYTWRKGGTDDPTDNHLYLTIGAADDLLIPEDDALIEIDPETKFVKFWGNTELLEGISFGDNTIFGNSLIDGSVTADKLAPRIAIDGSVSQLTTSRLINGIAFNGTTDVNNFAIVNTAGNNSRKVASVTNFTLVPGAQVVVKFTNNNTGSNPTLNVSETGDYPIRYNGTNIDPTKLVNNRTYSFVFDGSAYVLIGDLYEQTSDENVTVTPGTQNKQYNVLLTDNSGSYTGHVQSTNVMQYNPFNNALAVNRIVSNQTSSWDSIHEQTGSVITINGSGQQMTGIVSYKGTDGLYSLTGLPSGVVVSYTANDDLDTDAPTYVINLLDGNGNTIFPGTITAPTFNGIATKAEIAISDENGNNIANTYAKVDSIVGQYLPITGGQLTGVLTIPAIGSEQNKQASTVGYVDATVTSAVDALRHEIVGTAGEFGTIADLTTQVSTNTTNIEQLQQLTDNFVRFDTNQSLTLIEQQTARTNISAFSVDGGTINGSITVGGTISATNGINITNPQLTTGITPTTNTSTRLTVTDSTRSNDVGGVDVIVNTNGSTTTSLVSKTNNLTGTYQTISVTSNNDGSATTYAPTPIANSDDNSIATTNWVNDSIQKAITESQVAIAHKVYPNILAATTLSTFDQGVGYFTQIVPTDPLQSWQASYLIKITVPYSNYNAIAVVELVGVGQQYSYRYTVAHAADDLCSFDGINFRPATTSSLANNIGHYVGISMYRSSNPDTPGFERTIDVTVIKQENCVASLFDAIAIGSQNPDIETTHGSNNVVNVSRTGFYSKSNINYGDRLSAWDRVPVAGPDGLIGNSVVGEDTNGLLINVFKNGAFTTTPFDPQSIVLYTGDDLAANQAGTTKGTLFTVYRFDTATLGNTTSLTSGARVYLYGSIDVDTWLFTPTSLTTATDQDGYYLLLGYGGDGTNAYLIDNHPIYRNHEGVFAQVGPKPPISTPSIGSNDDTIATTAFVQQVAANVSAGSLINPQINTNLGDGTTITINAYPERFDKQNIAADTEYSSTIEYFDGFGAGVAGSADEESHLTGWIEQRVSSTEDLFEIAIAPPDTAVSDPYSGIMIGYRKTNDQWSTIAELTQSPDSDDNSNAIATTKYVQDNTSVSVYAQCTTGADVVVKTVTVDRFKLVTGATIIVDFTNGNTAANPTLNVNNLGAYPLMSTGNPLGRVGAASCIMFVYTGTDFRTVGFTMDNPTMYGTLSVVD